MMMKLCLVQEKRCHNSGLFSPYSLCRSAENKAKLVIKQEKMIFTQGSGLDLSN